VNGFLHRLVQRVLDPAAAIQPMRANPFDSQEAPEITNAGAVGNGAVYPDVTRADGSTASQVHAHVHLNQQVVRQVDVVHTELLRSVEHEKFTDRLSAFTSSPDEPRISGQPLSQRPSQQPSQPQWQDGAYIAESPSSVLPTISEGAKFEGAVSGASEPGMWHAQTPPFRHERATVQARIPLEAPQSIRAAVSPPICIDAVNAERSLPPPSKLTPLLATPSLGSSARVAEPELYRDVHVTIGRVEIRAVVAPATGVAPAGNKAPRKKSALSLSDYLSRRGEGGR
jgi:hypothetical protein